MNHVKNQIQMKIEDYHIGFVSGYIETENTRANIITSDFVDWLIANHDPMKTYWNAFDDKMIAMPDTGHQRCVLVDYASFFGDYQRWKRDRPKDFSKLLGEYAEDADLVFEWMDEDDGSEYEEIDDLPF